MWPRLWSHTLGGHWTLAICLRKRNAYRSQTRCYVSRRISKPSCYSSTQFYLGSLSRRHIASYTVHASRWNWCCLDRGQFVMPIYKHLPLYTCSGCSTSAEQSYLKAIAQKHLLGPVRVRCTRHRFGETYPIRTPQKCGLSLRWPEWTLTYRFAENNGTTNISSWYCYYYYRLKICLNCHVIWPTSSRRLPQRPPEQVSDPSRTTSSLGDR